MLIQEVPLDSFTNYEEPDDYLYHVTSVPKAKLILRSGFRANMQATVTNYRDYSKGKVFFTERNGVHFWIERIEAHLFNEFDDPPEVAVLRVSKAALKDRLQPDAVGTRDARAEAYAYVPSPRKKSITTRKSSN